jgi:hypothetical protein
VIYRNKSWDLGRRRRRRWGRGTVELVGLAPPARVRHRRLGMTCWGFLGQDCTTNGGPWCKIYLLVRTCRSW